MNDQGAVGAYARCGRCIEHAWTLPWVLAFLAAAASEEHGREGGTCVADERNLRESMDRLTTGVACVSSWLPKGDLSTELPGCSDGVGGEWGA